MTRKLGKSTGTARSNSTPASRVGRRPRVIPKGAPAPSTPSNGDASGSGQPTTGTRQLKTKRARPTPVPTTTAPITAPPRPTTPAPTTALRAARDDLAATAQTSAATRGSFASRFAATIRLVRAGVTIGIDRNLDVGVIRGATTKKATASRTGHADRTVEPIADGLDDPRLRDLDLTADRFMAAMAGLDGPARARFAAVMLGIAAADPTQVEPVADAALEGLRNRLHGEKRQDTAFPRQLKWLLNQATDAWRATPDADFWQAMALTSVRPPAMPPDQYLREQAAWLGIVAELGKKAITPPWRWNSAAEKADLVDRLIAAGAGSADPVRAIMQRVRTLQRGWDPLPRAIAAELAQMALAALHGVAQAPAPADRRAAIRLKERPPQNATPQQLAEHQARETLRSTAQDLITFSAEEETDGFGTPLFRGDLSRVYVEARENLRHLVAGELSGKERYERLLEVLGPLDSAVVDVLNRWTAAIATGSTDAAQYADLAREVRAVVEAYSGRLENFPDPDDPEPDPAKKDKLFLQLGPEFKYVVSAVRMVAREIGLEAGEVLLGQVAGAPADRLGGLRRQLAGIGDAQKLFNDAHERTGEAMPLALVVPRKLGDALKGQPLNALNAALARFDAEAANDPPDPLAIGAAADALRLAGQQAVTAANAMGEAKKRAVVQAVDLARTLAAEHVERVQGPDSLQAAALRMGVPALPVPAIGTPLDRFWSDQKDAALALLPSGLAKQVGDAMNLGLGEELGRLGKLAAAGAPGTEEQAWRVVRILRAYKAAANRLPADQADAKAKLQAALDGVALSVERLLPPPPPAGG